MKATLILLALIGGVAASKRDGYTYSCVTAAYPGGGFGPLDCATATTRDACLAKTGYFYTATDVPAASCSWRRTSYRSGEIQDTHWYYADAANGDYFASACMFGTDTEFYGNFNCMTTEYTYPSSGAGFNVELAMSIPSDKIVDISTCTVGPLAGRTCNGAIAFPSKVPADTYYRAIYSCPYMLVTTKTSGVMAVLATNTFKKYDCRSGDDRRRAATRRLLSDRDYLPWFRTFAVDKTYMGGADFGHYGAYASLQVAQFNVINSLVLNSKAIKAEMKASAPVYFYVIEYSTFELYTVFCFLGLVDCHAPLEYAVTSVACTPGVECEISAVLDPTQYYRVVVSTGTLYEYTPDSPIIKTSIKVDTLFEEGGGTFDGGFNAFTFAATTGTANAASALPNPTSKPRANGVDINELAANIDPATLPFPMPQKATTASIASTPTPAPPAFEPPERVIKTLGVSAVGV